MTISLAVAVVLLAAVSIGVALQRASAKERSIETVIGDRFATVRETGVVRRRERCEAHVGEYVARNIYRAGMMGQGLLRIHADEAALAATQYAEILFDEYERARWLFVRKSDVARMAESIRSFESTLVDEATTYMQRHMRRPGDTEDPDRPQRIAQQISGAIAPAKRHLRIRQAHQRVELPQKAVLWVLALLVSGEFLVWLAETLAALWWTQ